MDAMKQMMLKQAIKVVSNMMESETDPVVTRMWAKMKAIDQKTVKFDGDAYKSIVTYTDIYGKPHTITID